MTNARYPVYPHLCLPFVAGVFSSRSTGIFWIHPSNVGLVMHKLRLRTGLFVLGVALWAMGGAQQAVGQIAFNEVGVAAGIERSTDADWVSASVQSQCEVTAGDEDASKCTTEAKVGILGRYVSLSYEKTGS